MSEPLTAAELLQVAIEIFPEGDPMLSSTYDMQHGFSKVFFNIPGSGNPEFRKEQCEYKPSFIGTNFQRSQALAVVWWLCRKVSQMVAASATDKSLLPDIGKLAAHICMYTDADDITALQRMVLELSK